MLSPTEKECLSLCQECAMACLQCARACLQEEGATSMARCITQNLACADVCQLAANAIARGDEHRTATCALCAQVCQTCATECSQHSMDHCQRCTQACQRCAQACQNMA